MLTIAGSSLSRGSELVLIRLTMAAWMLPTDDHSFFEIMLGGEPYVAEPEPNTALSFSHRGARTSHCACNYDLSPFERMWN